jgi:aminoglycoside phosphotransferase family enzyme
VRGDTINLATRFVIESCIACGIEFALPSAYKDTLVEKHGSFYCPNGHSQYYSGKTEAEQLQEKLDVEKRNVEFWRKQEQTQRDCREKAERQRDAYKGHTTRLKKRVGKGKCPCCHATFVNLAGHMAKRHPEFGEP